MCYNVHQNMKSVHTKGHGTEMSEYENRIKESVAARNLKKSVEILDSLRELNWGDYDDAKHDNGHATNKVMEDCYHVAMLLGERVRKCNPVLISQDTLQDLTNRSNYLLLDVEKLQRDAVSKRHSLKDENDILNFNVEELQAKLQDVHDVVNRSFPVLPIRQTDVVIQRTVDDYERRTNKLYDEVYALRQKAREMFEDLVGASLVSHYLESIKRQRRYIVYATIGLFVGVIALTSVQFLMDDASIAQRVTITSAFAPLIGGSVFVIVASKSRVDELTEKSNDKMDEFVQRSLQEKSMMDARWG